MRYTTGILRAGPPNENYWSIKFVSQIQARARRDENVNERKMSKELKHYKEQEVDNVYAFGKS